MQRRFPRKKLPTLSLPALSLYTEEEIEDVPTSSSPITKKSKSKSTRKGDINISEVSSTSEDTNQLPSTSSKSIFMDLYEEDIWDSGPDDVTGVKDNVTTATVHKNKAKPGLSLLGEYTGSGNDTDEETLLSLGVKQKKPKETVDVSTHKNSSPECTKSEEVNLTKENSTNLETGGSEFSMEIFLADDKLSLHEDDISDIDIHALLDDSLAKGEKSKEDGQHSGFESSDCQKPSDSTTKSEKLKEAKKDKNKDSKHVGKGEKTKDKGQRSGLESSDNERLSDNKKDSKKLKEAKKDKSKKKDSKHVAKGEKSKEDGQPSGFKSSDNERLSDCRKDSKKLKEVRKDKSKKKDNKSLAKDDKIKEEGQLSESESSDSERLSDSRKDSKELKEARRDKSKKKKKKKKHRKQKQVTESKERSDGECNDDEKKIEAKQKKSRSRSKSQEISEKPKSLKRSRSRSRDRVSGRRRRSRSRSSDKRKKSKYHREKSRRSRSRSSSRRRSTSKRNKHLKSYASRSRSRNRSTSPPNKRKGRRSSISKTTPSRKESPTSRKRKLSRSPSLHKRRGRSSEHRRSRSPKRHSRSPGKRRRTPPEKKQKSPTNKSSSKKSASPNIRERKGSLSPARKLSHRTSSASDSLDSGHFTNIPLSNTNKVADDLVFDDKVAVQKSPLMEEQKEAIIPTKSANVEKKRSPSCSPLVKAWGDDFDFVITERLAPKEGTEKSVEDVLFGKEMADPKTPDFKRTTESIKSSSKESQNVQKKKETKDETMNGNKDIPVVCKENDVPQEVKTQQSVSDSQSIPSNSVVKDEQSTSNSEDSKADVVSESKTAKKETVDTCKEDHAKKTNDNAASSHALDDSGKSAFLPPKLETIPFLDEAPPPAPPPVSGNRGHPNVPVPSQLGPPPVGKGLSPSLPSHGAPWAGLRSGVRGMGVSAPKGSKGFVPTSGTAQKHYSNERDIDLTKKSKSEPFLMTKDEGRNNFDLSPMDMEMSSPEGDIIDRLHEEFWKQQKQQWNQSSGRKSVEEDPKEVFVEPMVNEQSLFEEPYEPETGLLMNEDLEEDLNSITDPKERRRKQKEKLKEKTKVQELIDKLHRQARVEEEVKHVLKVYYKHRDIDKEEYKSILRKAVPQVTNSGSSIDPERIRSLVKKYIAKIKGERFHCEDQG